MHELCVSRRVERVWQSHVYSKRVVQLVGLTCTFIYPICGRIIHGFSQISLSLSTWCHREKLGLSSDPISFSSYPHPSLSPRLPRLQHAASAAAIFFVLWCLGQKVIITFPSCSLQCFVVFIVHYDCSQTFVILDYFSYILSTIFVVVLHVHVLSWAVRDEFHHQHWERDNPPYWGQGSSFPSRTRSLKCVG